MNYRIFITCILLLASCSQKEQSNQSLHEKSVGFEEIKGIWNLSFYPDSCLIRNDIFKYSVFPASFAYQIEIQNEDSCLLIGFHESDYYELKRIDSVTYKVGSDPYQYFLLKFSNSNSYTYLNFTEFIDTTVY